MATESTIEESRPLRSPLRAGNRTRGAGEGHQSKAGHRATQPAPQGFLAGGPEPPSSADVEVAVARQLSSTLTTALISLQPGVCRELPLGILALRDLLVRNAPLTSLGNVELFRDPVPASAYGTGMPLLIGESLPFSDFVGPMAALCDPAAAGAADLRLLWTLAVPITVGLRAP
jgi:hypothetical protein